MATNQSANQSTPRRRRIKTLVFRILAIGGAFILAALATEAALWIFAPLTSDEWLAWAPDGHVKGIPEPNQTLLTGDGHTIRINNLGFRGPDYTWKPAPGTLRLATFGGSSTFGFNAQSEAHTWPKRLETRLSMALNMPVEVINLGLPGYDASNSKVNYLFAGRALHPHVALIYHTWNDLKFFRPMQRGPVIHANVIRTRPWWQRLARRTQIARRGSRIWRAHQEQEIENSYTSMEKEGRDAALPAGDTALDWARQNFRDFVAFTQSDGVLPVLITEATLAHARHIDKPEYRTAIRENLVGMTLPVLAESFVQMNAIIEEAARESGAVFVDGYSAIPPDFQHLTDHVHLTDAGRDLLAQTIAEVLLNDSRFLDVVEAVRNDAKKSNGATDGER